MFSFLPFFKWNKMSPVNDTGQVKLAGTLRKPQSRWAHSFEKGQTKMSSERKETINQKIKRWFVWRKEMTTEQLGKDIWAKKNHWLVNLVILFLEGTLDAQGERSKRRDLETIGNLAPRATFPSVRVRPWFFPRMISVAWRVNQHLSWSSSAHKSFLFYFHLFSFFLYRPNSNCPYESPHLFCLFTIVYVYICRHTYILYMYVYK